MAAVGQMDSAARASLPGFVRLRWALRGAGCLACAATILLTPELISTALRGGAPLKDGSVEVLLAYRVLALLAGAALLLLAERLPRLGRLPEALLGPISGVSALFVLAGSASLKSVFGPEHSSYTSLVREDSVVEYATSLTYLGAGCVAAVVARGLLRRGERPLAVLWAGLAAALVLVGFEEISWGQRLFGMQTPELLASNVQGELTLHNMPWAQSALHVAYIAVGLLGGLAWTLVPERGSARFHELVRWLVPPRALLGCFLPVALFYAVFTFTPDRWIGPRGLRFGFLSSYDQEPAELLLSLGFLLFAVHALARLRGGPRDGRRSYPR